jgi:hypothetical protein
LVGRHFFSPSKDVYKTNDENNGCREKRIFKTRAESQQPTADVPFFYFIFFFPDSIAAAIIIM